MDVDPGMGQVKVVALRSAGDAHRVEIDGDTIVVDGTPIERSPRAWAVADGDTRWVFLDGEVFEFEVITTERRRTAAHHGSLSAPMPATVVRVNVVEGATVKRGETLVVLEAMKMELPVRAPQDGTVSAVHCVEGQLVQPGVPLVEFDA